MTGLTEISDVCAYTIVCGEKVPTDGKLYYQGYDVKIFLRKVQQIFDDLKANVKDWEDEEEIQAYLLGVMNKERFDRSGLIYGLGHAVYAVSDPRKIILKEFAKKLSDACISGWSAHRLEELVNKGRIIRPAYRFVGVHKEYQEMEERE